MIGNLQIRTSSHRDKSVVVGRLELTRFVWIGGADTNQRTFRIYAHFFGILVGTEASVKNSGLWISGASVRLEEASGISQDQNAFPT